MLEKIQTLPLILFVLVGVGLAGMNYMSDMESLRVLQNKKSDLVSQINEKTENFKKAENSSKEIPNLKSEITQLTQIYERAMEIAPSQLNGREVVDSVTKEAKFAGVRITSSKPTSQNSYRSSGQAANPETEELGLDLVIEGSYSQITFFFYQLSKIKMVLIPKNFDISVKEILDNQVNLKVSGTIAGVKYLGAANK